MPRAGGDFGQGGSADATLGCQEAFIE